MIAIFIRQQPIYEFGKGKTRGDKMIKSFNEIFKVAKQKKQMKLSVAVAEDKNVLKAIWDAKEYGIADACLVGDREKIFDLATQIGIHLSQFEIYHETDKVKAARKAVSLVSCGYAQIVMKGLVDTSIILKAVLDKEIGLRGESILSHVSIFEIEGYDRLLYLTDAAMNIAPSLEEKVKIIQNGIQIARALNNPNPKVAAICAVEKVNPKMEATIHAEKLVQMNERGELKDCILGGPLALDNAISQEAGRIKKINHPVAGKADILLVPYIEVGNVLYKALFYFANAKHAGIIVGAKSPIVLTSRSDNHEAKLRSIALGVVTASNQNKK